MKIIFFGNTKYSVIVAKSLHNEYGLSSIVTIPDRPIGRKKILTPSPVKQFALENNIPVLNGDSFYSSSGAKRSREVSKDSSRPIRQAQGRQARTISIYDIAKLQPDFLIVADYGLILPKELLAIPKFAPLNVHHSLLPKYRGPSPAPTAILNGDKISGVTIIQMTGEVDAGPILAQKEYQLKPDETTDSLLTELNTLGGKLVVDVIKNYETLKPIAQDESAASMTKRMTKQDGYIDFSNPPSPEQLDRMIRAYYPWPTVWTRAFLRPRLASQGEALQKESIVKFLPGNLIQVEGGKPMSVKDFLNGYPEMKGVIEKLFV